jgi:hypothetical protein
MIKLILANKPEYVGHLEAILEQANGTAEILREPNLVWFLFVDDTTPIGLGYAYAISDVRMFVDIVLVGEHAHHPERKQIGRDFLNYLLQVSSQDKFETAIPKQDTVKVRYFSQLGFKREGIAKLSIKVNGELVDQHYMGLSR